MAEARERFVLRLERPQEGRLLVTLEGPAGPLHERRIDWTGAEAWYRLTSDRKAVHERMAREAEEGRDGLAPLGNILFADVMGSAMAAPLLEAASRGADVHLQIECPNDEPRLVTVPWQLLHDGESYLFRRGFAIGQRLVRPDANLVRLDGPFRVLILFASPIDAEVPPVEAELQVLEHVYRSLPLHARVETLAYGVKREAVERAWQEAKGFHAVHVMCPGTHDTLLLEGERGRSEPLFWTTLAHTVRQFPVPWLVTLGTGRWPRDPWRLDYQPARDGVPERSGIYELGQPLDWSAFATACAQAGVPLVLSYQLPIDARAGRSMTERFCHGVLSGEMESGAAWRAALAAARATTGGTDGDVPPPALLGRTDVRLAGLPTGPTEIAERRPRPGVDVGLFPEKPVGYRYSGRYHVTATCLRRLLDDRGRSLVVTGAPAVGKTSFVENLLHLAGDAFHAVRRSTLRPESTVESLLAGVAAFCAANGWEPPTVVLRDVDPDDHAARATVCADALVTALEQRGALLLVEDAERALEPRREGDPGRAPLFADPALGLFLARVFRTLRGSGLWLVTATVPDLGAPLPEDVPVVTIREPQPRTARELFERHEPLAALDLGSTRALYLATRGLPGLVASLALLARRGQLHAVLADLVPRKMHAESESDYREHMVGAVVRATIDVLSEDARRLFHLAGLFEKPERPMVAEQLGFAATDAIIGELVALDLVTRLRPRGPDSREVARGPAYVWTNPLFARAAREHAAQRGGAPDDLRERLGAFHALSALEQGRASRTPGLSDEDRVALLRRRRLGLRRAFSYFARAGRWARAAEVTVRAAEAGSDGPLRAETRRMCSDLLARAALAPLDTVNVLSVLATLDAHDGLSERVIATYRRAAEVAHLARREGVEAGVRLRLARALEEQGEHAAAAEEATRAETLALAAGDAPEAARAAELGGRVALESHRAGDAAEAFARAADLFVRVGESDRAARTLRARAGALLAAGDPAGAVRSVAAGWSVCPDEVDGFVVLVERLARAVGEDVLAREWLAGSGEPLPSELLVVR